MGDLGGRLKEGRRVKGISLREIEGLTKISVGTLEALERNDFGRLPGGIFSRAFVRAYAREVGLDQEEAVQEFLTEFARWELETASQAKRPEISADDLVFLERQRKALRTLRVVIVVIALAGLAALAYIGLIWWPSLQAPAQ